MWGENKYRFYFRRVLGELKSYKGTVDTLLGSINTLSLDQIELRKLIGYKEGQISNLQNLVFEGGRRIQTLSASLQNLEGQIKVQGMQIETLSKQNSELLKALIEALTRDRVQQPVVLQPQPQQIIIKEEVRKVQDEGQKPGGAASNIRNADSEEKDQMTLREVQKQRVLLGGEEGGRFELGTFQILLLFKQLNALDEVSAITVKEFKDELKIKKTTKTLRSKIKKLTDREYIAFVGEKPRYYYLTKKGLSVLNLEQKDLIALKP